MSETALFEGVAIVGAACRVAGAANLAQFWDNLIGGVESVRTFAAAELREHGVSPDRLADPRFVPAAALVDHYDCFDGAFFGFTPRESQILDPQHRLFFECAWEALEHAGYDPGRFAGPIGLFAGTSLNTYLLYNLIPNQEVLATVGMHQMCIANDKDFLATHISYKFNLRGPSVTVQTACSTSLAAVQFAYQSLLTYQCDMALAGGVSLQVPHEPGYVYQDGGIASPDGHCRAFDGAANGTVSGSGVGAVVLKRLADAVADRDHIIAVIRGAAINNDGGVKMGFTAPSVDGQAEVIALAQAQAGVEPDTIGYIEAHGTGTPLGDPIEVAALTRVFRASTARRRFCALGSVKTNIGHLDAAAGVVGLIKAALAVQHGRVPPSLHFRAANPRLDLETSPFYVNAAVQEWDATPHARRAGVSSFGIGGTNVHVVLEEAPPVAAPDSAARPSLFVLSARTEKALDAATERLALYLGAHREVDLADAAYTLQVGRREWPHRLAIAAASLEDAAASLARREGRRGVASPRTGGRPVVFLFPGQGSQYAGMGDGLYRHEPTFRARIDHCAQILRGPLGFDIRDVLTAPPSNDADARLRQTGVAQPTLFAVEYALAHLWMEWGVKPSAMIGHSLGEYLAACLSGVFSVDEALRLLAVRGRLMQSLPPGAMIALPLSESEMQIWLDQSLSIAAVNGPRSCVVSGPVDAVEQLEVRLRTIGIAGVRLNTSHAFHSAMMDPILDEFRSEVGRIRLARPAIPYVSNLTGTWIREDQATSADYWAAQLRGTVRFADGLQTLLKEEEEGEGDRIPLEVGPGQVLTQLCRQLNAAQQPAPCRSMRQAAESRDDVMVVAEAVGALWAAGAAIDWHGLHRHHKRGRIPLPTYPFDRARHWIDPPIAGAAEPTTGRPRIDDWLYVPRWSDAASPPLRSTERPETVLLLANDGPIGSGLARVLTARRHDVVMARHGSAFERLGANQFALLPCRDDYQRLIELLRAEGRTPRLVYHALSAGGGMTGADQESAEAVQERGFFSLLWLCQALGRGAADEPVQIIAVVDHLLSVQDGDVLAVPERASILGPCHVAPQEYPHIRCRVVDVQRSAEGATEQWLEMLAGERLEPGGPALIAYRNGRRWQRSFERGSQAVVPAPAARLKQHGVYWISGGSGDIGLAIAAFLGRQYRARVILSGRSAVPPRGDGSGAPVVDDVWRGRLDSLERLQAEGIEIVTLQADAARADEMTAAADEIRRRFGRIDGIVHAAGIAGGGLMPLKTRDAAMAVLAPKVIAAHVLAQIAQRYEVGFVALCSSIAALQGGFGQVDYAGGNAVLDAFAPWHTQATGIPTFSIGWDAWLERGMAVEADERLRQRIGRSSVDGGHDGAARHDQTATVGIKDVDGVNAFRRIVEGAAPQVAVSTVDLNARVAQQRRALSTLIALDGAGGEPVPAAAARQETAVAEELEQQIAAVWQRVLGLAEIGWHDNFFEIGGDSLAGVQLISRLNSELQLQVTVAGFFEAPTIAGLAELVRSAGRASQPILEQSRDRGSLRRAARQQRRVGHG